MITYNILLFLIGEEMIDNKEIGNRIRILRKKGGFSQEKMAEKLNIGDRAKISRIENGKQSMTANEMIKFCELLNISLDALINDKKISSKDYIIISDRYIKNEQISIEERKEVIRKLYIELANMELNDFDMLNNMNKNIINKENCSKNIIEKYGIDVIL